MKIKGISLFERHVEKAVLVVFVLVFLGVFAAQFLREPNAIQVNKDTVAPSKIAERIESEANVVSGKLDQTELVVDLPEPPNAETFLAPLRSERVSQRPLAFVGNRDVDDPVIAANEGGQDTRPVGMTDVPYHLPEVPTVTGTLAALYAGAIDPLVPALHPEVAPLLPAQQPFDAFWVTVQGSFDVAKFRTDLVSLPGEDKAPLPAAWTDTVEILAVDIVRERLLASGSWDTPVVIGELPGKVSLRARLDDPELNPRELLTELLGEARARREEIRRPSFYPLIAGDAWTWPGQILAAGFDDQTTRERDRLVRQRRTLAADITRIEKQLNPATKKTPTTPGGTPGRDERSEASSAVPPAGAPSLPPAFPSGAGGGSSAPSAAIPTGGGGRRPSARPSERRSDEDRARQTRADLEKRLKEKKDQLAVVDGQLAELGFGPEGFPLRDAGAAFEEPSLPLVDESATGITLWAHDLTAKSGETYRYGLRVRVTNPLFGNAGQVPQSQVELAGQPTLTSEVSEWSDPITIPHPTVYFVTSGRDGGAVGGIGSRTTATIEVFRFFYGFWRSEELVLSPGEPLASTIELPEGLSVFTIEAKDGGAPAVTGSTPVPTSLAFESGALLLDVATAGGGPRREAAFVNVFLSEGGEVVARDPAKDAEVDTRLKFAESSRHAEDATVAPPSYKPSEGPRQPGAGRPVVPGGRAPERDERPREERERPSGEPGSLPMPR